jgi:hypothetical protein
VIDERSAAPNGGGLDQPLHAAVARLTSGLAPAGLDLAYTDWLQHYLLSPDKQISLFTQGLRNWQTLFALGVQAALRPAAAPAVVELSAQDKRTDWLIRLSGKRGPTPALGAPAAATLRCATAPGTYVHER